MDLTIKEIKDEQVILEKNIEKLLNDFHQKTTIAVKGAFNYYHKNSKGFAHHLTVTYENPFE